MARSISISLKSAQTIQSHWQTCAGPEGAAFGELLAAIQRAEHQPRSGLRQAGRGAPRKSRDVLRAWEKLDDVPLASSVLAVPAHAKPRPTKAEKQEETSAIREACLKRAAGKCECGCGQYLGPAVGDPAYMMLTTMPELDHFFGRGRGRPPQSVETCWILRADCHREKTNNRPDVATWLRRFLAHLDSQNSGSYLSIRAYAENRLAFVETRSALPAAPRAWRPDGKMPCPSCGQLAHAQGCPA